MQKSKLALIALALAIAPFLHAQVTGLSFRPVDAKYSTALDRIIMISASPNVLHVYNGTTNADRTVSLPNAPLSLSLSSDGLYAAVAYSNAIDYVNLQTASVQQTYSSVTVGTGAVILGSGYIYVFPASYGPVLSINIANAVQTTTTASVYASGGVFDSAGSAIYTTQDTFFPALISRYDVSGGAITTGPQRSTSFGGTFSICGPLTLSHDGATIYSGCGTVFSASTDATKDMLYKSSLPGVTNAQSIATSDSLTQIAFIPKVINTYPAAPAVDAVVNLFNSTNFSQTGQFATTPFSVNSTSFIAHGRRVFYNAASTAMYILTQADSSAGLELDYAVENVNLTNVNSCNATFGGTAASSIAPGTYGIAQILSSEDCVFTATSNASWIVLTSGYYGSGNTSLTYLVRPNLTSSSRSGTISIGSSTFTITQDAAVTTTSNVNPLSYKPVAADYDKALDKIVFVSASPNELHLYDPLTFADQIVPLSATPISVSVRPDGLFAAVSHNGSISYVDLQALAVTQQFPVNSIGNNGLLLAGNGYIYFGSSAQYIAQLSSLQVSTGTISQTNTSGYYYGTGAILRLHSSGNYIYSTSLGKFDITAGVAASISESNAPSLGSNLWLSEDGNRLLTSSAYLYFTSAVPSQDLTSAGSLPFASSTLASGANSKIQHQTAVLFDPSLYSSTAQSSQLQIYADNGLSLQSQLAMSLFTVGSNSYSSHGRYLFWNSAASKLFAVTEADSTSGLLSDFAVNTVAPQSLPACSYVISPSSITVGPSYVYPQLNVASSCSWVPSTASGGFLSVYSYQTTIGNGSFNVTVSSNAGAARSQTVTVGNATATINQTASTCTYTVSAQSANFNAYGGTGSISLSTPSSCAWMLQSSGPWLTISSAQSGTGSATIQYSVAPNTSQSSYEYGSISMPGAFTFNVYQNGVVNPNALSFVPITPCRVADTRNATGPFGGPYISAKSTLALAIPSSACNIPSTAAAYSLNVTVVPHGSLGYLTVWPTGQTQPTVSTLNSIDGRVKANAAIIPAGTNGSVSFYATNDTDLVLDINGYFTPASASGLFYSPLTPCRVSDTRSSSNSLGVPMLPAGVSQDLPVLQSTCTISSTAQAYSINFTAVPQNSNPLGYLSVWPAGQQRPLVSTLNAPTGVVTANFALLPAGTSGDVNVFASNNADLVTDINGYFAPSSGAGLSFYTVSPCRVLDTRQYQGQPFNGQQYIQITGPTCNIPSTASAIVVNATVVPSGPLGYLTLWPSTQNQPLASTLNATDGSVTSNLAIVPMQYGYIYAYASNPTHLILDVTGYFAQ